jgi:hypothetical protein
VLEMLGIRVDNLTGAKGEEGPMQWNEAERKTLQAMVAARQPFLDFVFNCINEDGKQRTFQVSGEPMFTQSCRFIGYRGIGVELSSKQ